MESPYDVLRIDPDADEAEVERAFRRRVIETHPDQGGDLEEFRAVMTAYEEITAEQSGVSTEGDGAAGPQGPPTGRNGPSWSRDAGAGPRGAGAAPGGASTDDGEARRTQVESTVRYLNYEVLDDHGWSLADDDLFEKAASAGLDEADFGRLTVEPGDTLLEAAEDRGFSWPYSCRGGACANCAVAVVKGEMAMSIDNILTEELLGQGIRLSCIGAPTTGDASVVFNVKHMPDVEELLLPPGPFAEAMDD